MANITKLSTARVDGISANRATVLSELFAGQDLAVADACYIKAADGKVYKSVSTVTTSGRGANFDGFTNKVTVSGEPVSLFGAGAIFGYAAAMTPGQYLYVSATAGLLSDAVVASNDRPIAKAISATDILVIGF